MIKFYGVWFVMFYPKKIKGLNEYFMPLSERTNQSVFFYRIAQCSDEVIAFLKKYYDSARKNGVIVDGRIPNPDVNNLSYFKEMLGDDFLLDKEFISHKLKRWLPRMSVEQRENVVSAMYSNLCDMRANGKNDNMIKNAYIKFMCWFYYKFERIAHRLGENDPPKVLYDGTISNYELQFLAVLSRAGADIVLIERSGDASYLNLDPCQQLSILFQSDELSQFPEYFNLKWLQNEIVKDLNRQRLYGQLPDVLNCTNAWMNKADINAALTETRKRGGEPSFFYNSFIVQYGVADKLMYSSDLFAFYKNLSAGKRKICIANRTIPIPTPEEIAKINRGNYKDLEHMVLGLSKNIQCSANIQLQRLMVKSFVDVVLQEGERPGTSIQKLTNKAVYLLCWLRRYQQELFSDWNMPDISVFILFGQCATETEALFLKMLSKLPVDVLILIPDLNASCCLNDPSLLELKYSNSLGVDSFPVEQSQMRVNTAAYQAERELDILMYQDTGMYRNKQYSKAETVVLRTMYEEISILWDQELKYRPNFATFNDVVTMPVLLEKVCGVKNGHAVGYWLDIKKLITPDTIIVKTIPWISTQANNPIKPYATQFLQNKRIQKSKIKNHKAYQYGILREEIQDYLLDKLQMLLDQKMIKGTYENGTEYTIISTVLNINKDLLRMIQKFDFTKKNPKLIFIITGEKVLTLEDSIMVAFLSLVGFDVLFFVPTGYQCIERYFNSRLINEHQIGDYLYDLSVPNFNEIKEPKQSAIRNLFRRSE